MTRTCLVLNSGGPDAAVLLAHAKYDGWRVASLYVDYGQRAAGREALAAAAVAQATGVRHATANFAAFADHVAPNALTDAATTVPRVHHHDPSTRHTVVPYRNLWLVATAAAMARRVNATHIGLAVHGGGVGYYPDTEPRFLACVDRALQTGDDAALRLWTPFAALVKPAVLARGHSLGVSFANTWSCYTEAAQHCGTCPACHKRRAAFQAAGIDDPTLYTE